MPHPHIAIAGAGIIGLSLALELHARGLDVLVLDRSSPLAEASTAAAGMLAVDDPDNPAELHALSRFSRSLYPAFLDRLHHLSGHRVAVQTHSTLQAIAPTSTLPPLTRSDLIRHLPSLNPGSLTFTHLDEISLDPRDLATALLAAVRRTTIDLRPHTSIHTVRTHPHTVGLETSLGPIHAEHFVDCTGAWSISADRIPHLRITPRKGQMLALELPPALDLHTVVRTHAVYIVPRTSGPNAGRVVVGATVEDVGFDKTVHPADLDHLHAQAADLLPALATAPVLDAWAGLRPSTPDHLPLLGRLPADPASDTPSRQFIASGHFRNGILLAPATAHVLADLLSGSSPVLDLSAFSPARASIPSTPNNMPPHVDIRPEV